MDYLSAVPDRTFNRAYQVSIFLLSFIAFLSILENIIDRNAKKSILDKVILSLDVFLILASLFAISYYYRKMKILKRVENLSFKMFMLTFNTFVVGILGIVSYNIV